MTMPTPARDETLAYRVSALERELQTMRDQIQQRVTTRELELELRMLRASVDRIEHDTSEMRKQMHDASQAAQEEVGQRRTSIANIKIWVLAGVLAVVLAVVLAILEAIINRF